MSDSKPKEAEDKKEEAHPPKNEENQAPPPQQNMEGGWGPGAGGAGGGNMKFIMFLFLGSMAFDMIVKNVFPTTNTGDPKEVLKQATPIPNEPSEVLHHSRHD